jgi:hypothetical protein
MAAASRILFFVPLRSQTSRALWRKEGAFSLFQEVLPINSIISGLGAF